MVRTVTLTERERELIIGALECAVFDEEIADCNSILSALHQYPCVLESSDIELIYTALHHAAWTGVIGDEDEEIYCNLTEKGLV